MYPVIFSLLYSNRVNWLFPEKGRQLIGGVPQLDFGYLLQVCSALNVTAALLVNR